MKKKILLSLFTVIFAVTFAFGLSGFDKTEKADAATSLTISAAGKAHDMASGAVDSTDNTKANFSGNKTNYSKDQGNHYGWVKIAGDTTNGVEIINFTVTQTGGSDDLNLVIGVLKNSSEDWPYNNNTFYGLDASNSTGSAYSLESKNLVTLPTISSGNSNNTLNVTLTLSAKNKDAYLYLYFCPHITSSFNNSSFSVSNIFFGAAETEPEFTMVGAQMRFDEPTGIRFVAELEDVQDGYSYGMLILPKNIAEHCVDVNTFNSNLDYIDKIDKEAEEYFAYLRNKGQSAQYYMSSTPKYDKNAGKYYVYGSIASVLYNNTNRDFFALAFKENESGRKYASFTSGGKSIGNLGDIVKDLYDDDDLEDGEIEILDYYLLRSEYQAAGVSQSNYESDTTTGTNISISMRSEMTVYVGDDHALEASVEIKGSSVSKAVLTYTSDKTDVATVDENGLVTGISKGTATITVSYLNGKKTAECAVTVDEITLYNVTVTNGSTNKDSAPEGATVTITADTPAEGKRFNGWTVSDGDVTLADSTASTTTFRMGTADVTVVANYVNVYTVTVTNGTSNVATAAENETVTITANDPATGYAFNGWTVSAGGVTLSNASARETTFTMGTAAVTVVATYRTTVTYATLHSVGKIGNGNNPDSITADTSTSATLHPNMGYGGDGQENHVQYVEVNGASGKSIVSFTLHADKAKNIAVGVLKKTSDSNPYQSKADCFYTLSGVTVDGNNATNHKSEGYLFKFDASADTDMTVSITLSGNTTFGSTALVTVWPYAGGGYENGSIVVKNFNYVTPTSYDITMSSAASDLASVSTSSATAGTTVTLSAKENGKAVTAFTYTTSSGTVNVTGKSFTMPAADVTITSVTVEENSGENITYGFKWGGNQNTNISGSGTDTLTVSDAGGNDEWNCVAVTIANMVGKSSITFTITNTGSNTYNFLIWMATGSGQYEGDRSITSATNASTGGNKNGVTGSVSSGSSLTITINLSSSIGSNDNLRFAFTGSWTTVSYTISGASVS